MVVHPWIRVTRSLVFFAIKKCLYPIIVISYVFTIKNKLFVKGLYNETIRLVD
jgi:hypothetical protein